MKVHLLSTALLTCVALSFLSSETLAVETAGADSLQRLLTSQLSAPRFKQQLRQRHGFDAERKLEQAMSAVLRFTGPLTEQRLRDLEQRGIRFERVHGQVAHIAGYYGVRAEPQVLAELLDAPDLLRLLPPRPRMLPPSPLPSPYDKVHQLTTARDLWPTRDAQGQTITGAGVTICDIDGAADIFHPMFFRPDAGLYAWIDVNDDGVLTPDVDAVDLNANNAVDDNELLRALGGNIKDIHTGEVLDPVRGFHPARQWLYADTDRSGRREFGPERGFVESDPAYGEPLFLADDVDRNGSVDAGEKLWRLGSSKYKGVYRPATATAYERGDNLIDLPINPDAGHGTGVGGILAGGEYGRNLIHGVAPDAELLLISQDIFEHEYDDFDEARYQASLIAGLAWAQGLSADVMVHEYGTPVGEFADGSSDWELLLDQLSSDGVVQTTATHNFADNLGHAWVTVPANGSLQVPFEIWDTAAYGYPVYWLEGTLRWRTPQAELSATLIMHDGVELTLAGEVAEGEDYVLTTEELSDRGTSMLTFLAVEYDPSTGYPYLLTQGNWALRLDNPSSSDVDVYLTLTDETGYSLAVGLGVETTQLGTMAHPSTADSAISVGASVGNSIEPGEEWDGIKRYSGRGPRIDGALGVDVVAPEDHYTAAPEPGGGGADYMSFGGTSGALPQVAGAIALLLQVEPELTPAQVKQRLHERSVEDELTGALPNPEWGHGRLATYRLVTDSDPVLNTAPVAALELPALLELGERLRLDASASHDAHDDGNALLYRFDVGYDGIYDVEGHDASLRVDVEQSGTLWVKLEVQDSAGAVSHSLASVQVIEARLPDTEHTAMTCSCRGSQPAAPLWIGLVALGLLRRKLLN